MHTIMRSFALTLTIWICYVTATCNLKVYQGASSSTLIMPCELAANMVGLSLFQHTALMKWDVPSSLSSAFGDSNLWQEDGFDISCETNTAYLNSENKTDLDNTAILNNKLRKGGKETIGLQWKWYHSV
jgi:hypothetical protein